MQSPLLHLYYLSLSNNNQLTIAGSECSKAWSRRTYNLAIPRVVPKTPGWSVDMFIPLRHDSMEGRRWPVISIALVVLNLVAFLGTHCEILGAAGKQQIQKTVIIY